ncbi:MAG: PilN domain-containing protein [Firmicutes bacterium]|nr:PilN domain-containing protein [Bacillota bacterium]
MPYRKTVSIEIGPERVRAVELTNGRKKANVFNVLEFDTPPGCVDNGYITNAEKLGTMLRTYLGDAGILTVNTVFSVISEDILVGGAEIQRGRKKDVDEAVREKAQVVFGLSGPRGREVTGSFDREEEGSGTGEAGAAVPDNRRDDGSVSIDDYYTSYIEQEDSGNGSMMNAIIYAAPSDLIDSYYELADAAQLSVSAVDYSGNSLFQWMLKSFGREAVMMIDLRRRGSTATIVTDGVLRVQVDMLSRTDGLVDAIRERDEIAEMEDFMEDTSGYVYGEEKITDEAFSFVEEINSIAAEFLSENVEEYIDRIVITSGGEGSLLLARLIRNKTGIDTLTLEDLPSGPMVKDQSPFADLNPGSYLSVLGAVILPLSFRPPESNSEYQAYERRDLITRILMIIVIVCLIVTAVLCVTYFILRSHNKALQTNLDKISYIEDIYEEYQKAEESNSEIRTLDKSTEQKNELLSQLFSDLESKMPTNSHITSMNSSDDMVTFSVRAGDKEAAAQFIMQLRKIDYLSDIDVSELTDTKNSAGSEAVDFTVSAYLSGKVGEDYESSDGANDDGLSTGNYRLNDEKEYDHEENEDEDDRSSSSSDSSGSTGQTIVYRSMDQ